MNSTSLLYLLSLLSPCQPYAFHLVTEARSETFPPAPQGCLCQFKETEQNSGAELGPRTVRNELTSTCEILSSSLPFTYSSLSWQGWLWGFKGPVAFRWDIQPLFTFIYYMMYWENCTTPLSWITWTIESAFAVLPFCIRLIISEHLSEI